MIFLGKIVSNYKQRSNLALFGDDGKLLLSLIGVGGAELSSKHPLENCILYNNSWLTNRG